MLASVSGRGMVITVEKSEKGRENAEGVDIITGKCREIDYES